MLCELGDGPENAIVEQVLVLEECDDLHDLLKILHVICEFRLNDCHRCRPELLVADVVLHTKLYECLGLFERGIRWLICLVPLSNVVGQLFNDRLVIKVLTEAH